MKNLIVPLVIVGFIGLAVYNDQKSWNKIGENSTKEQRLKLIEIFSPDIPNAEALVNSFLANEVSILHTGLTLYTHPTEASKEFQERFYAVAEKYNLFT